MNSYMNISADSHLDSPCTIFGNVYTPVNKLLPGVTTSERKLAEAQLFILTSPKIGARRTIDLEALQ